ncbi:hypothetical protein CR513_12134, partial [Mucuna pruriens]
METTFKKFTLHHNERADLLSKLATIQKRGVQRSVIHESISRPTIEELTICCMEERRMWMSPLMAYLKDEQLPNDPTKAKKLVRDAAKYIIIGGELYRREAQYVVKDVHDGVCGTNIGSRALANKIVKASYY